MTYSLDAEIPGLPKLQTNSWGSWRPRDAATKRWLDEVAVATHRKRPSVPLSKPRVRFTRYSTNEPDYTNLVASFKPVEDALVTLEIILDDKPGVIGVPTYKWEKASRRQGRIRIQVWGQG